MVYYSHVILLHGESDSGLFTVMFYCCMGRVVVVYYSHVILLHGESDSAIFTVRFYCCMGRVAVVYLLLLLPVIF